MPFFKRNNNGPLIPPVPEEPKSDPYAAPPPSNRYAASDPYAKPQSRSGQNSDPYALAAKPGENPYAKQSKPADAARDELFAGFKAPDKPAADRKYGYEGRETEEDFDQDEEVEGIKQEMRGLKQDSLASSRWVRYLTARRNAPLSGEG